MSAAPTLTAEGASNANTSGTLTVTLPAHAANDILILSMSYLGKNSIDPGQIPTPSGWTLINSQIPYANSAPPEPDAWSALFWLRATSSSETNPVCSRGTAWDTGPDTCFGGRAYTISGALTSGTPWDDAQSAGPYDTANQAVAAVTVSGDNRLVIHFYNSEDNNTPGTITGWTAGTADLNTTGLDCGFQTFRKDDINTSTSADAGTAGAPSNSAYQFIGLAFIPTPRFIFWPDGD